MFILSLPLLSSLSLLPAEGLAATPGQWLDQAPAASSPAGARSRPRDPTPVPRPRRGKDSTRRPTTLELTVLGPDGRPVPSAMVRFALEDEVHRVHAATGRWSGQVLYPSDGDEVVIQPGLSLDLAVWAPGFAYTEAEVVVERPRTSRVELYLTPWQPTAGPDAPEIARKAVEAHQQWVALEEEVLREPTEENQGRLAHLRSELASLAREWMDLGGGPDARQLCLEVGSLRLCGG